MVQVIYGHPNEIFVGRMQPEDAVEIFKSEKYLLRCNGMPSNDGASLAILNGIRGWWPWPTGGRGIGVIIGMPGGPGIGGPPGAGLSASSGNGGSGTGCR
jgi:hypothetical protein